MADTKISALPASTTPLAGTEVVPLVQSGTTKNVSVANLTAGRDVAMASGTTTGDFGVGTTPSYRLNVVTPAVAGRQNMSAINRTLQNFVTFTNPQYSTDASMGVLLRVFPQSDARQGAGMVASGGAGNAYTNLDLFISEDSGGASVSKSVLNMDAVSKDVTATLGNFVQGTAGKGVNFTANTPAAGMTSQLLNWYEEGTFTPVLFGTSTAGTATYATQSGVYTRVGNRVHFDIKLEWSSFNGTGAFRVSGLPFNSSHDAEISILGAGLTFTGQLTGTVVSGGSIIYLRRFISGDTNVYNVDQATPASGTIIISGSYKV